MNKKDKKILLDSGVTYTIEALDPFDRELRRKYGITLETYKALLKSQNDTCAICFKKSSNKRLNIDHCHSTNLVRGILCFSCNVGLGHFNDSVENLERAIKYLKDFTG